MIAKHKVLPRVYLVTGVHNDWAHTQKFLDCAQSQTYKNLEIIVVDDGSTDETSNKIINYYPNVRLIEGDGTLWWTGCLFAAVNEVLTTAKTNDYLLTINNDCAFGQDYINNMIFVSKRNPNCVIGSLGIDNIDKNTIIDSGAKIDWLRGRVFRAGFNNLKDVPKNFLYDSKVDTLTTRGTLYPMSIIKKVGNFDNKHLPHYISDFEYACRVRRHGFGLVIAYECKIYNDTKRTGFSGPENKPISLLEYRKMLFGRKSQINIIDHYNFIRMCCPWYLQPLNYIYLIAKIVYISSFLPPFFPFRMPIVKLRKLLLSKVE